MRTAEVRRQSSKFKQRLPDVATFFCTRRARKQSAAHKRSDSSFEVFEIPGTVSSAWCASQTCHPA